MTELFINTASSQTSFICLQNDKVIINEQWHSKNNEASLLLPKIRQQLEEHQIPFSEIKKITAIKGPGSFTGLRIGITIANTLARHLNAKLFEVDLFTVYRHRHLTTTGTIIIKAGRNEVYLHNIDSTLDQIELTKFTPTILEKVGDQLWGDLLPEQESQLKEWLQSNPSKTWIPECQLLPLFEIVNDLPTTEITLIKPLYIKQPTITKAKP